jgi:anti-sigma regulatory factor (Ser/Thr protein kinase)
VGTCVEVSERASCVVVPHHVQAASMARRRLATALSGRVAAEMLADVIAVASELVGNAVLHARPLPDGGVRVAWQLGRDYIELRVTDGGAVGLPHVRRVGPESSNGRGLNIVATLSDRWGISRDGLGQCVWAELRRAA